MGERLLAIKGGPASDTNQMSEITRHLMFRVMADDQSCLPILHLIWNYTRCDDILRWLYKNGVVGPRLNQFLRFEFGNSPQSMVKYVLWKIEGERKEKILYGKDWKP